MIVQIEDLPLITPVGNKLPKYRQIAAVIEEYLRRTNLPAGTKFFTDRMLAGHFRTTPVTVAHSLNYLAENGLLKRKAGSGTYSANIAAGPSLLPKFLSFRQLKYPFEMVYYGKISCRQSGDFFTER